LHLQQVWLFGSYARNEQQEYSDIDVALVADEFESIGFIDVSHFADILIKYPLLEPHTYNTNDFITFQNPFAAHIQQTGIRIL
jgi:predicted nucleotidyltransferase